jgi:hypothetical protein
MTVFQVANYEQAAGLYRSVPLFALCPLVSALFSFLLSLFLLLSPPFLSHRRFACRFFLSLKLQS